MADMSADISAASNHPSVLKGLELGFYAQETVDDLKSLNEATRKFRNLRSKLYNYPFTYQYRKSIAHSSTYMTFPTNSVGTSSTSGGNYTCVITTDATHLSDIYISLTRPPIQGVRHRAPAQTFPTVRKSHAAIEEKNTAAALAHSTSAKSRSLTVDGMDDEMAEHIGQCYYADVHENGISDVIVPALPEGEDEVKEADARSTATTATASAGYRGIVIPGIGKYYAYFVDGWAYRALTSANVMFNTTSFSPAYGEFSALLDDIRETGHARGIRRMAGCMPEWLKHREREEQLEWLVRRSARPEECWVNLNLGFCTRQTKRWLPVIAIDWMKPSIDISIAPYEQLIVRADRHTRVVTRGGNPLSTVPLGVSVVVRLSWVDPEREAYFQEYPFDIIYRCVDVLRGSANKSDSLKTINIRGAASTGPISAMHLLVQRESARKDNSWDDYTGLFGQAPVRSIAMSVGGRGYQPRMPANFYNIIHPSRHAGRTPTRDSYHIFFDRNNCDSNAPSGTWNPMSSASANLHIEFQPQLIENQTVHTTLYREFWLALSFKSGNVVRHVWKTV